MLTSEPDQSTTARLIGAIGAFNEVLGHLAGDPEMPIHHVRLIGALFVYKEILQSQLPKYCGVKSGAVSKILTKMRGLGILDFERVLRDRRKHRVWLTEKGREVVERATTKAVMHVASPWTEGQSGIIRADFRGGI